MTFTVLLEGGPFNGQRHEFMTARQPDAYQPYQCDGTGMYYRTGRDWAGMPIYEWSEE